MRRPVIAYNPEAIAELLHELLARFFHFRKDEETAQMIEEVTKKELALYGNGFDVAVKYSSIGEVLVYIFLWGYIRYLFKIEEMHPRDDGHIRVIHIYNDPTREAYW